MIRPRVAVVGGGLAGLAAAVALCDAPCDVTVFEARRQLGGRASSFRDPATGELVDFCQHVSMACCTNLADFCLRAGIDGHFSRERTLYFVGPNGRVTPVAATRWLPAPLHLAPALLRLPFLSFGDRLRVVRGLLKLARSKFDGDRQPTISAWLRDNGQMPESIERFWSVVLVSALGESLDRSSLSAARKVFVDGFLANRAAYEVMIPKLPLSELFGNRVSESLRTKGTTIRAGQRVERISRTSDNRFLLVVDGIAESFDFVVHTVPWRQIGSLIDDSLRPALPWLDDVERIQSSPITGVHLWFDREITSLPHAVLVGRLSQWLFNRGAQVGGDKTTTHAYQVVISASRELAEHDRDTVVGRVCDELRTVWPEARAAKLVAAKVVTEQHAVFSADPDVDRLRPAQTTEVAGLFVSGDWTATGWPSTMEGAVRSGYLAAEGVLKLLGKPRRVLVDDLPVGWLARRVISPRRRR